MEIPKQAVEHTRFISINDVKELEEDSLHTFTWHDGESIAIYKYLDHILLSYKLRDESMRVYVELDTTRVGYGYRLWLVCPVCSERAAKLYNVKGIFACRVCHDLTYLTCKVSGNRLRYLALKISRLQHKLGMDTNDIHESSLFKPKNMHQQTYWILKTKLEIMQMHFEDEWLKSIKW